MLGKKSQWSFFGIFGGFQAKIPRLAFFVLPPKKTPKEPVHRPVINHWG
jgi:hypothetical protein